MSRDASLQRALSAKEVLVVCGAGGVGKTTVSAALAVSAAAKRDVAVLTIDPARRLATALGLDGGLGHELRPVDVPGEGSLDAAMLDMHTAWDAFVERYAPNSNVAANIRGNALFRTLSDHFVGSQSYMAMERLAQLHERGEHHLIVIDTPPTRSALDFLEAPARMTDFVGGSLLKWLAKPYAAAGKFGLRAFSLTATPFMRIADRVLGSQLLEDLSAFVVDFQTLYQGFRKQAEHVQELLHDRRTGFVVVTTLEDTPLAEAGYFIDRLADDRLPLAGVVANRVVPPSLGTPETREQINALEPGPTRDALEVLADAAQRDAQRLRELERRAPVPVAVVPLMTKDVTDIASLAALAKTILRA